MKTNELIRLLRRDGCYEVKDGKGGHAIWFSPNTNKNFVVAVHGAKEVAKENRTENPEGC